MLGGVIEDVPNHQPPPTLPPPPKFSPPVIDIPPTDVPLDVPADDEHTIQQLIAPSDDHLPPPSATAHLIKRVLGGPGKGFPNTNDFYPYPAIRAGEKGVVGVRTCVDDTGRLTAAPTIARPSGSSSLDEGALKLAKAGSGHYRPTTEDGLPVSSCYEFLIRFDLRE
jgi:TonB family protein